MRDRQLAAAGKLASCVHACELGLDGLRRYKWRSMADNPRRCRFDPIRIIEHKSDRGVLGEIRRQPVRTIEHRERFVRAGS
jgi:hypothetical protein